MNFLQHLEILRWHLIRCALAIVVGSILAFSMKKLVFDLIIMSPKSPDFVTNRLLCFLSERVNFINVCINTVDWKMQNFQMTGQFLTHLKISLIAGVIFATPYIIWELWRFILPALKQHERRYSTLFILTSSSLFFTGIAFGYFILAPISIHFFITYSLSDQIQNIPQLSSYINLVISIPLACAIVFELPLILFFLSKIGLVSVATLQKYRRHAFVILLVLSAIITPPDVFSQILICIPLTILYELGILVAKRVERQRNQTQLSPQP